MSDLICLDCKNYDIDKEWCTGYYMHIPCTDESGSIRSCIKQRPLDQPVKQKDAIWWGADENNPNVQWFLCQRCNEWFSSSIHLCKGRFRISEDFLTEKEMTI